VAVVLEGVKVKMITFPLGSGGLDRVKKIFLPRRMKKWDLERD